MEILLVNCNPYLKPELHDFIGDFIIIFTSESYQKTLKVLSKRNIEIVILNICSARYISTIELIERDFKKITILITGEKFVLNFLTIMNINGHKFIKQPVRLIEIQKFIDQNRRMK